MARPRGSTKAKEAYIESPLIQKRAAFVQSLTSVLYQHFQGGEGSLSEFYAAQEARAFYNRRYDAIKDSFISKYKDEIEQIGEGQRAIVAGDSVFSVVLSITNGATVLDATKLANEMHKLIGKKLTLDLANAAIEKATVKRAGAKRFEAVIGGG